MSKKVKGPSDYQQWERILAVWGQMATGGGHTPLKESMSVLGVPVMNKSNFQQTERDTGEWWTKRMEQAVIEAGQEERRLAQELLPRGASNYHDCGWLVEQMLAQAFLQCQIRCGNNNCPCNKKSIVRGCEQQVLLGMLPRDTSRQT